MQTRPGDNEIINRVLQGEQALYADLVKRYQNFVFSIVLRYMPNREDAEEIAQDVFIKAYRSLADFRGECKFSTWLYTIVTTTSITFLRKKKIPIYSLNNEKVVEVADRQNPAFPVNQAEQRSKKQVVNKAIRQLSVDDARIITLFYQAEQSLEEIGRIIGVDPNTAKVKLHRARRRLKEKMERHYSEVVEELKS